MKICLGPWLTFCVGFVFLLLVQMKNHINLLVMQEEGVLRGQELENAVSDADYAKAIQLAFELRRPHKLFELFAELCRLVIISLFLVVYIQFHLFDMSSLQEERG